MAEIAVVGVGRLGVGKLSALEWGLSLDGRGGLERRWV